MRSAVLIASVCELSGAVLLGGTVGTPQDPAAHHALRPVLWLQLGSGVQTVHPQYVVGVRCHSALHSKPR